MRLSKEEYIIQRLQTWLKRLECSVLGEKLDFNAEYAVTPKPVPWVEREKMEYRSGATGDRWGKAWESAWFKFTCLVPESWNWNSIAAQINLGCEACVFSTTGEPLQRLTQGSVFDQWFQVDTFPLSDYDCRSHELCLWVEASASRLNGVDRPLEPLMDSTEINGVYTGVINSMCLRQIRPKVKALVYDVEVLFALMLELPEKSVRRARILHGLNAALNVYTDDWNNAGRSRDILRSLLESPAESSALDAYCLGHAHLDTIWLWRECETIRKCGRTFASQLTLLNKYPEYIFGASQAQHYQYVKEHYPSLYCKIAEMVKTGRWEVLGGMWVEPDCNLPGGESLVRQLLYGKRFFQKEFGIDVRNAWLPDAFGYSASLPQIFKLAGIKYFMTKKVHWSRKNEFPHNTFRWRGIDGSEILAHVIPQKRDYNSPLEGGSLVYAANNFKEKAFVDSFLVTYGVGDGGGGPGEEMIERGLRMRNLEGSPHLKFSKATDCFESLSHWEKQLEVWSGELYVELHRGTLTSQARLKKQNRKLEQRLRQIEALYCTLPLKDYPAKEIEEIWKRVLVFQFHDCLPGTSICEACQDVELEYEQLSFKLDRLQQQFVEHCRAIDDPEGVYWLNALTGPYCRPIELPKNWTGTLPMPCQIENDNRVFALPEIPGQGFYRCERPSQKAVPVTKLDSLTLENKLICYKFDSTGKLISAWDKELTREFIDRDAGGNVLSLYIDRPIQWDAWDIEEYYHEELADRVKPEGAIEGYYGPVRQYLDFSFSIGNSRIKQRCSLASNSKRLDFETSVDWNERHRMLRVAFNTTIHTTTATYEIPYGQYGRPTHRNTSWEKARFEACGHRFVDITNGTAGLALLNDCKYGYEVSGETTIDLALLRSPTHPDHRADAGTHSFIYSLLPHAGCLAESNVRSEAEQLNMPPLLLHGIRKMELPVLLEGDGLSLESIKKAEDDSALIVRIVETRGHETSGSLETAVPAEFFETDLLERSTGSPEYGKYINFSCTPFQILTYKIIFK